MCFTSPATAAQGQLELEDEDGKAVPTTAKDLIEPIRRQGRPLPLVFLKGLPRRRAERADGEFLGVAAPRRRALCGRHADVGQRPLRHPTGSRVLPALAPPRTPAGQPALAKRARRSSRLGSRPSSSTAPPAETQPEYATAALRGGRRGAAGGLLLGHRGAPRTTGVRRRGPGTAAPHRRADRAAAGVARDPAELARPGAAPCWRRPHRARRRGQECGGRGSDATAQGGRLAGGCTRGSLRPAGDRRQPGEVLLETKRDELQQTAALLLSANLDDGARFHLLSKALAEDPVVLVLDDFEQNLSVGGGAFLDPNVRLFFGLLAQNASRGRLLLTCRHPVPGMKADLHEIPIGPLSPAEARKLVQRLPKLRERRPSRSLRRCARSGGIRASWSSSTACFAAERAACVTSPRSSGRPRCHRDRPGDSGGEPRRPVAAGGALGRRDVLLKELVGIVRGNGDANLLFQAAVSTLPTSPAGLAHMLADGPADVARSSTSPRTTGGSVAGLPLPGRLGLGPSLDRPRACEIDDSTTHAERCNRRPLSPVAGGARKPRPGRCDRSRSEFSRRGDFDAAVKVAHDCFDIPAQVPTVRGDRSVGERGARNPPRRSRRLRHCRQRGGPSTPRHGADGGQFERYEVLLEAIERRAQAEPDPPITSVTSPSPTSGWATSTAPSVRATRRGTPTSSPSRSESVWPRPSPTRRLPA